MTKAYIDSKNNTIIIHNSDDKTSEELHIMHEAAEKAGYKCIIFSKEDELEFLNSEIINL
ncbi:hypothetical protein [Mammaliicoccus sciuri]|uniref:hypothetical protein n=1 Tax=Mammaliicoccus sciuri TaxID=1296 RepID=UPI0021CF8A28|nr:hypothetical protein [Mammaliicoccus sciuri]UXU70247.1 hypothetical protein MUA36_06060 [Mammaliicoccus sciuri]